jgi:hypothetical protein
VAASGWPRIGAWIDDWLSRAFLTTEPRSGSAPKGLAIGVSVNVRRASCSTAS